VRAAPLEEYDEQPHGLWSRLKHKIGLGEEFYEDEEIIEDPGGFGRPAMVRVRSSKINRVSVWLTVSSFENAQQAADGLKEGHQQIVNLERAAPEICTRIIDFLNGVTYALDGFVEKVGEKVYLFTPSNYVIEVENAAEGRRVQGPFHDN
jgi:cell division inhibitor SepF